MLRPLTNIDDDAAMAKVGRMATIRNHRLDALHDLRDCVTRLNSDTADIARECLTARECLDRLELLSTM